MNTKIFLLIIIFILGSIVGMLDIIFLNYNPVEALVINVLFYIAVIQTINFLGIFDKSK